jgi:dihydroorotase-like cyclic amidohydrolase
MGVDAWALREKSLVTASQLYQSQFTGPFCSSIPNKGLIQVGYDADSMGRAVYTIVNGQVVYDNGAIDATVRGRVLSFG